MDRLFILRASSSTYQSQWKGVFNPREICIQPYRDSSRDYFSFFQNVSDILSSYFPPHLRKLMTADALYDNFENQDTSGSTAHSRRVLGPQKKTIRLDKWLHIQHNQFPSTKYTSLIWEGQEDATSKSSPKENKKEKKETPTKKSPTPLPSFPYNKYTKKQGNSSSFSQVLRAFTSQHRLVHIVN